jgi:hypothetical protein
MESNVAEPENRTFDSLAEALALVDFDLSDVLGKVLEAEWALYDEEYSNTYRLAFTFRVHPSQQESYPKKSGWVQHRCDLTGLRFAAPKLAPVPQVLLFGEDALERVYVLHPDFLNDRSALFKMIVATFEEEVSSALYEAKRAASVLDKLRGYDELPGLPSEGTNPYPTGDEWDPIGSRPIDFDDE